MKFSHAASENKRAMHQHMVHAVCLVRARIGAEISSSCDFCMVRKLNEKKNSEIKREKHTTLQSDPR